MSWRQRFGSNMPTVSYLDLAHSRLISGFSEFRFEVAVMRAYDACRTMHDSAALTVCMVSARLAGKMPMPAQLVPFGTARGFAVSSSIMFDSCV